MSTLQCITGIFFQVADLIACALKFWLQVLLTATTEFRVENMLASMRDKNGGKSPVRSAARPNKFPASKLSTGNHHGSETQDSIQSQDAQVNLERSMTILRKPKCSQIHGARLSVSKTKEIRIIIRFNVDCVVEFDF